ncbi:MAG: toll/interleukin-1 receptor domain-containing protein [Alphaproteobacteria bacterium HGW-Alphaproteobacteria-18]|nr:MAG: toll/interleukin-1 receptor domain-containing protein [Alphaproteobacteria bacterium HGW-Alphaproteobacteria-18]
MKVFISWSGARSKALALCLKDWLPLVLQYVKPWVSDKDISAGERWAQAIAGELESSNFGILCITPENISSEWIMFEAGALSKSMQDAKVIPLLLGLELSDLSGPLSQFQALKVDQAGILDVVKAINAVSENKAADNTVERLVPALWPQLEQKLSEIPDMEEAGKQKRPPTEILEDLVSQVRGLNARIRETDLELIDRDDRIAVMRRRESDPRFLYELVYSMPEVRGGDWALLLIAGIVREQMPWVAEVLVEAHRDLKFASHEEAREIGLRLAHFIKQVARGPFSKRMMSGSKHNYMLLMELPELIHRAIDMRIESSRSVVGDNLAVDEKENI